MTSSAIIIGVIISLIATEILGLFSIIAKRIVLFNARRMPLKEFQGRFEEEWLRDMEELPGGISKLVFSIGTFLALSRISHDYSNFRISFFVYFILRCTDFTLVLLSVPLILFGCCLYFLVCFPILLTRYLPYLLERLLLKRCFFIITMSSKPIDPKLSCISSFKIPIRMIYMVFEGDLSFTLKRE